MLTEVQRLEVLVIAASESKDEKFEKRKQLLPRERVARLLDRGTPFLEISRLRVSPARQCRKNALR